MSNTREIKFRAWDKGHNKMSHKVNLYSMGRDGDMNKAQIDNQQVMKGIGFACEIMQFTGLKDKNGKEIYEGDVVTGWRKGSNSDKRYTGVIEWQTQQAGWIVRCGKFTVEILSLAMSGDGTETRLDSFEIIGNIYEHPELLQKEITTS